MTKQFLKPENIHFVEHGVDIVMDHDRLVIYHGGEGAVFTRVGVEILKDFLERVLGN